MSKSNNQSKPPFLSARLGYLTSARLGYLALTLGIFYLLYSLSNIYSANLYKHIPNSVHILATSLDTHITFIPIMIVPYGWSLLLFCASFFMVNTRRQLTLLTYRLILATLLACLIFYFYPARFSFIRPILEDMDSLDVWVNYGYQFLALSDCPTDLVNRLVHQVNEYKSLIANDKFSEVKQLSSNLARLNRLDLLI